MIALDLADIVVIAGRVIGIDADAALALADITAAQDALTQARSEGHDRASSSDRVCVAEAGIGLVHALLRHRPFPPHGEQVAVAAGLQLLSLNGWRADLEPPAAAAVVVEALASGRLRPADAAAWLEPRLSPVSAFGPRAPRSRAHRSRASRSRASHSRAHRSGLAPARVPLAGFQSLRTLRVARLTAGRMLVSAMLALALGGLALLATACSRGPGTPAVYPRGQVAVRQSAGPERPVLAPSAGSHARPSTCRCSSVDLAVRYGRIRVCDATSAESSWLASSAG
jgi:hypothetical protein